MNLYVCISKAQLKLDLPTTEAACGVLFLCPYLDHKCHFVVWMKKDNVRVFEASNQRAPLPLYFSLLTLQGHECVSGLKMIVKHDDSFEFFTASDKWLPRALHDFFGCHSCTYHILCSFTTGSFFISFFCLLNRSAHFQLKLGRPRAKHRIIQHCIIFILSDLHGLRGVALLLTLSQVRLSVF